MPDRGYWIRGLWATLLGAALFAVVAAVFRMSLDLGGVILFTPYLLTPIFLLPVVVFLARNERIMWLGCLYLILLTTAAFFLAWYIAFSVLAAHIGEAGRNVRPSYVAGAYGGLIGAGISFIGIYPLIEFMGRWRAARLLLTCAAVLGLIGALGLAGGNHDWSLLIPAAGIEMFLFFPWQVFFGAVLVISLSERVVGAAPEEAARPPLVLMPLVGIGALAVALAAAPTLFILATGQAGFADLFGFTANDFAMAGAPIDGNRR